MSALVVELGWPDSKLSPNARVHWAAQHGAKKVAREAAFYSTRSAMGKALGPTTTKVEHDGKSDVVLRQVAHPPDKRQRDRDGIDARLKAARDGIADALGINDRFFRPTGIQWGDVVPGGRIVITVELAA